MRAYLVTACFLGAVASSSCPATEVNKLKEFIVDASPVDLCKDAKQCQGDDCTLEDAVKSKACGESNNAPVEDGLKVDVDTESKGFIIKWRKWF